MKKYSLKPSEEIYEIEFDGVFLPSKFTPAWFHKNGLIGAEEAEEANIIQAEEGEILSFSTKFLRITVETEKFAIATAQILSFDLVKDMAVGVSEILRDSIGDTFSVDVQLHFKFGSNKKFNKAFDNVFGIDKWNQYLNNPRPSIIRVVDDIKSKHTQLERSITIYPCYRDGVKNTLHLYISNLFKIKSKKHSVWDIVSSDNNTLKDTVQLVNQIIETEFKI